MRSRITELSCKEVINICDGTRYGFVNDVEVDCACGRIVSLIVHCSSKFSSLFSKNDDIIIPWESIKRIGDDLILVDNVIEPQYQNRKQGIFSK
ncbi:MAG: YlmC/YmxH family sporulation protein [Oscillospiraceae bacterium]|nr:YlmC/YmxH family sporulation protein [Oscillospiraceae bacterium]